METTSQKYLTPSQLAAEFGVTKRTIRNLTKRGLLPVTRLTGKIILYPRVAVEKSLQALTVGAI